MKLLIDNQLPLALAVHLRGWGLDCIHVLEVGLSTADDRVIWDRARADDRIVVTKDEDFHPLIDKHELVRFQQHLGVLLPRGQR